MSDRQEEIFKSTGLQESERTIFLYALENHFIALARQTQKEGELHAFRNLVAFLITHLDTLRHFTELNEKLINTCQELKEDNKDNAEFCALCDEFLSL